MHLILEFCSIQCKIVLNDVAADDFFIKYYLKKFTLAKLYFYFN